MLLMIENLVFQKFPEVYRKLSGSCFLHRKVSYISLMFSLLKVNKIARAMYEIINWALQTVVSRNDLVPTVCARLACSHVALTDITSMDVGCGM